MELTTRFVEIPMKVRKSRTPPCGLPHSEPLQVTFQTHLSNFFTHLNLGVGKLLARIQIVKQDWRNNILISCSHTTSVVRVTVSHLSWKYCYPELR